jgi:glycosyltransferase involved in cell wall biosynthesis
MDQNLVASQRRERSGRLTDLQPTQRQAGNFLGSDLASAGDLLPKCVVVGHRGRRSRTAPAGKRTVNLWDFLEDEPVNATMPRRIRVCVLDPGLQVGGAEWFTALLMQFANPHLYEFVVLCYRPEQGGLKSHIESLGIKVISATMMFDQGLSYREWLRDKLWRMLELQRPDIVYFSSNYLYARILAETSSEQIRNYPVVVRISNFDVAELAAADFSAATKVICCSDEQYAHLSQYFPDKAVLIKTGVDVHQFHPIEQEDKRHVRQELDLPQQTTVLFCGRLSDPLKRTNLFEQVVDRVLAHRDDVTFLVVGYFESHRNAEEEAFKQFVSSRDIIWKNDVQPWDMPKYYQAADLLLSVSDTGEGLSNTVLQGLASGLVPLVTPASGMSELVQHGENGFLLEDDDPSTIAQVLLRAVDLDEATRARLGANARERAKSNYNLRDSVHAYEHTLYGIYEATPARVALVDGTWGIGGAEWLAALLCLNCDPSKLDFHIIGQSDRSELVHWLAGQGVPTSVAPTGLSYNHWREGWLPRTFRSLRPHVVMPCTSTNWDLSSGNHRLLGISQNASDAEVLQQAHYDKVAYLICVSEDVRSVLDQRYRYKMTVLRNSIDVEMFRRNESVRREVRARIDCEDKKIVLWCGRMSEPRKRLDVLCGVIDACADRPDLHFLVLGYFRGQDAQQEEWERFLDRHPNVTWISGVRHWEMPAYYSAVDFFLSTSGYTGGDFEGLSLASVQALAAGLPIVSTSSGGQGEVVTAGINGYLTPAGDVEGLSAGLKRLCDLDGASLESMWQRNVEKAATEFNIQAHARRYETICSTLKNTVDAALHYDSEADTELLEFDDAAQLSASQRHQASFFINHISPLLRDSARDFFTADRSAGSSVAWPEFGRDDGREDVSGEELHLLQTLAEGAVAPILEMGCFLHATTALMARHTSQPVYALDLKHDVPLHEAGSTVRRRVEAWPEGAEKSPMRWREACDRYWRMMGAGDRIKRIARAALRTNQLPGVGLVVLHEGLSHQDITDGMVLAGELLVRGGFVVLKGCHVPDDHPETAGGRLLGAPASALLDYMRTHFPFWRQPYQVASSVVLCKSP